MTSCNEQDTIDKDKEFHLGFNTVWFIRICWAGLGHFLLTSRMRRSCDAGVGGFILVTLGCWFHCRYNYAKLRIQERTAREGIQSVCQQAT
ncbi:cytochrome c oxidase assembly protein COX20, mitochondrial-like [Neomonachus schauinslandi]|uniref:Cytochrome c oxidase assembly protein COX20, mitochondrial n=1 Tax=Neomonachus schauinslandi TaxID=29088 RepID=A0A8M1MDP3_NEOSC|nr:cytochrome c oxidase assembly protein COX20, mitochondrial-like [Neomonachus schauinslandi]